MLGVVSRGGVGDEFEDVVGLLTAGFDDGQQCLEEATALCTLGAEVELAPDHRRAESAFAGIVRRFDSFVVKERPEPLAVLQQFLAGARRLRVTTAQSASQQSLDLGADGGQHSSQTGAGEELIAMAMPPLEQPLRLFQQVFPQLFRGGRAGIDEMLEVAHEMSPAPLQPFQPPVHFGSVATDHAREPVGQQFVQHGALARRSR